MRQKNVSLKNICVLPIKEVCFGEGVSGVAFGLFVLGVEMKLSVGILLTASVVLFGAACSQNGANDSGESSSLAAGSKGVEEQIAALTLEEGGLVKQRGEVSERLSKAQAKYKGLVAKRQDALKAINQNNQAMSSSVDGTVGTLKTVDDVSNEDLNNAIKEINAHVSAISAIDKRLSEIDSEISKLTRIIVSINNKLASIKKHRDSKQLKVEQLKRQHNDLVTSYEGHWRCNSFSNLTVGLVLSAAGSDDQEQAAVVKKVAERSSKCAWLNQQLESKRAELNQGIKELTAANELLLKTISGDSVSPAAGPKSSVLLDAAAGCYKLTSSSPLFKSPSTTDVWGPNSNPDSRGHLIGTGALVYIHKRLPTGRLQITAKSGTFFGMSGFVPETIARTKVDGGLCAYSLSAG